MVRYKYQPDYRGLNGWLLGPEAHTLCVRAAEEAAVYARSIAPVGDQIGDDHPGRYRESIHVDTTPGIIPARGRFAARTSAAVVAEVVYAAAVEVQYGHHTLKRAAQHISSPKPSRRV